jgi:hypothetical protein
MERSDAPPIFDPKPPFGGPEETPLKDDVEEAVTAEVLQRLYDAANDIQSVTYRIEAKMDVILAAQGIDVTPHHDLPTGPAPIRTVYGPVHTMGPVEEPVEEVTDSEESAS